MSEPPCTLAALVCLRCLGLSLSLPAWAWPPLAATPTGCVQPGRARRQLLAGPLPRPGLPPDRQHCAHADARLPVPDVLLQHLGEDDVRRRGAGGRRLGQPVEAAAASWPPPLPRSQRTPGPGCRSRLLPPLRPAPRRCCDDIYIPSFFFKARWRGRQLAGRWGWARPLRPAVHGLQHAPSPPSNARPNARAPCPALAGCRTPMGSARTARSSTTCEPACARRAAALAGSTARQERGRRSTGPRAWP